MMQPPPRLWRCLTREWVLVPEALRSAWWLALCKAQWSLAAEWRQAFLAFHRREAWTSAEDVARFFGQMATPRVLFGLLESLIQEGALLKQDGHHLETVLLEQLTAEGEWKHPKQWP
jgi:hypothetical protein